MSLGQEKRRRNRLLVAMHDAPGKSSSFVTVTFPPCMDVFDDCYDLFDRWRPKADVRDIFFRELGKLLGEDGMKIDSVHYLGGVGAKWFEIGPKLVSYTQEGSGMVLEDGLKMVLRREGEPPFDRAKWNKVRTLEDVCLGCLVM